MSDAYDPMSNPYQAPRSLDATGPTDQHSGKATASLVLGLISIVTWVIPLFGLPTTIAGLVPAIKGLGPQRRGKATAGIVLSIILLVVTVTNSTVGAYLGAKGQLKILQQSTNVPHQP
jgi:hypothetical protein